MNQESDADNRFSVQWPPMTDFAEAAKLRDLLIQEAGRTYVVCEVAGGFGVARAQEDGLPGPPRSGSSTGNSESHALAPVILRPAWRIGWMSGVLALLMGGLAIGAHDLVPRFLDALANSVGHETVAGILDALPVHPATLVTGAALLLCGWILLGWVYHRYVRLYRVTPEAVEEHIGIVARQTRRVRLQHVRSVGLRQTFFGRIFNVGDLEFASAGTGQVDVVFQGIRRPAAMRGHIQELMNASQVSQ